MKRLTIEEIREYLIIFKYILISKEYISAHQKLNMICPKGHEIAMSWNNFKCGKRCNQCSILQVAEKNRFTYEYVQKYIENYGYILLSDSYINNNQKLKMQCNLNHIFYMDFSHFKNRNQRCPFCSGRLGITDEYISLEMAKYGYKLNSKYKNAKEKLEIICPNNHSLKMAWDTFRIGTRCAECNESKGEQSIKNFLLNNNIKFERQYIFNDCKNINPLPFDFAVFDNKNNLKYLIEYDGEFHYKKYYKEQNFEKQQHNDQLKTEYCINNNIALIRIPYWNFDNIENILISKIRTT